MTALVLTLHIYSVHLTIQFWNFLWQPLFTRKHGSANENKPDFLRQRILANISEGKIPDDPTKQRAKSWSTINGQR